MQFAEKQVPRAAAVANKKNASNVAPTAVAKVKQGDVEWCASGPLCKVVARSAASSVFECTFCGNSVHKQCYECREDGNGSKEIMCLLCKNNGQEFSDAIGTIRGKNDLTEDDNHNNDPSPMVIDDVNLTGDPVDDFSQFTGLSYSPNSEATATVNNSRSVYLFYFLFISFLNVN